MKKACMKIMEFFNELFGCEPDNELLDDMNCHDCRSVMGHIKIGQDK